jgi:hypothetical protein
MVGEGIGAGFGWWEGGGRGMRRLSRSMRTVGAGNEMNSLIESVPTVIENAHVERSTISVRTTIEEDRQHD